MSLNFKKEGRPIAKVIDKGLDKEYGMLYVADKPIEGGFDDLDLERDLKIKDGEIQMIPGEGDDTRVIFVTGMSGSGKSYWIAKFVKEFHKKYKKRHIFFISPSVEDPAFSGMSYMSHVILDREFLNDTSITVKSFENSLVIMDDVEGLNDLLKPKIYGLMYDILSIGRKLNVTLCVVQHEPTGHEKSTRKFHLESKAVTFYPDFLPDNVLVSLCERNLGIGKKVLNRILKYESRAVTFIKGRPRVVLMEKNAIVIRRSEGV